MRLTKTVFFILTVVILLVVLSQTMVWASNTAAPATDVHTLILPADQDAWIWKGADSQNYGSCDLFKLNTSGGDLGEGRPLLHFDLSAIPVGAVITSAQLQLTKIGGATASHDIEAHRLTAAWDEGPGDCSGVTAAASWQRRIGSVGWSTVGGDFDNNIVDVTTVSANGIYTWNLTSLAQSWVDDPVSNLGVLFGTPDTGTEQYEFASREHADILLQPQLLVSYIPLSPALIGRVWRDDDRDAVQDFIEPGFSGVRVRLYAGQCGTTNLVAPLQTNTTNIFGWYGFYNLENDDYCVQVEEATLPPDLTLTTGANPLDVDLSGGTAYDGYFGYASALADDRLIVGVFAPCPDASWLDALAASHGATSLEQDFSACIFTYAVAPANFAALETAAQADSRVRATAPDVYVSGASKPNDPDYNNPSLVYGPQQINAETAWDETTGDPGLIVAVVDTGIDFTHPEFGGRVLPGWDFVNDDADPTDDNGHGTHVAGIIAAGIDNGIGIAGMAGTVQILPVKVLNANNTGWWSNVAAGITWAVDQGANVINLSLTGSIDSTSLQSAIAYAVSKGATVIVAAGNNGTDTANYPASYDNVVSFGATTFNGVRWTLSNYGPNVDVMAPGAMVYSTKPGNSYAFMSGTSMAAPHGAGVAALLLSKNPNLTPDAVKTVLQDTAADIGDPG